MTRIVRVVVRGDVSGLVAPLRAGTLAVRENAAEMVRATQHSNKYEQSLRQVGTGAGVMALGATAALGAAVLASADFEQAMSRVEAATHANAETMDQLSEAAIQAGADTVFSATEAADAITAMSKAGVGAADILGGGLTGALALASAGELDVATAADIAATAMNQFGLAGDDIPHIADLLAAAAGKAQGEVTDMANSLKYVGPIAHQMNIPMEEAVGTIAELASQGILGEQAGTSIRGMLSSLTSPSKVAAQEMKNYNIELYDARGNFIGLAGVAGELQKAFGTLSAEERDAALGRIFGNEQLTAARVLYAGGAEEVKKWTKAVDDEGYAAETAALKLDNLKGDVEQFTGSLQTLFITSGEGTRGPLRDFVQGATDLVNVLNDLPGPVKNTAVGLLEITAVTGGAAWLGSVVIRKIALTKTALDELNVSGTTVRGTLRTIGTGLALGATLVAVQQLSDALGHDFDQADLPRDLEYLATNGDGYSKKFKGLASDIAEVNSTLANTGEFLDETASLFGLAGDTNLDKAQKNIRAIDQALAQMVESGNADAAATAFARIVNAAKDNGTSEEDVTKNFDAYTTAVENARAAAEGAAPEIKGLDHLLAGQFGFGEAATETGDFAKALVKAKEELQDSRAAASETAADFVGLGKDVDNSKVSLDGWIDQLEDQAKALEDFGKNAKEAARRHVRDGLIKELQEAGPEGALRLKQLADATKEQIREANRAYDEGRTAVHKYTDAVGGIQVVRVRVNGVWVNVDVSASPDSSGSKRPTRGATRPNGSKRAGYGGSDGDPTTAYWGGGYTGNVGIYEKAGDVHGREFVFDAQATEGNVSQLYALQDSLRRGVDIPTAAGQIASANPGGIDMAELRALVASMQPMIGHQTVTPHNYNQFRREQEQVRRLASVGGRPSGGRG